MQTGAREGETSPFRRLLSWGVSRELRALVVPGEDVARARGLDLEGAGLALADGPRRANVLVLAGELSPGLRRVAAIAYAQMPRPRAILAIGVGDASPLPEPDISAAPDGESVAKGVEELRSIFARNAYRSETADFDAPGIETRTEYTCAMHPEILRDEPGSCPICGMDLVPRESVGGEMDPDADNGEDLHQDEHHEDPGSTSGGEAEPGAGDMDHGSMSHDDMDFMSMVEMTKDLPRGRDGLPMERVDAPFGPLFPGLPGGLALTLTLDGDAVVRAGATSVVAGSLERLSGPAEVFPERMSGLDPLSPTAYRLLAVKALEDMTGVETDGEVECARAAALERERVASHLGWLAGLARLLGHERLRRRAGRLQVSLLRQGEPEEGLKAEVLRLARSVGRDSSIARRMRDVGKASGEAPSFGPVARAAGEKTDARLRERAYRNAGFEPVVLTNGDALDRLGVRLAEIEWSLGFQAPRYTFGDDLWAVEGPVSGEGVATVETPRGAATLRLVAKDGEVEARELLTPSQAHLTHIGGLANDTELATFLVGVASLDISPWGDVS